MKQILMLSIIFLLLSFTGRSQSITVKENKLCFDSAAAVELYKTIIDRESFAQEVDIYQELYESYDSLILAKDKQKSILQNEISRLNSNNQSLQDQNIKHEGIIESIKKQKIKNYFKGLGTGITISAIGALFLLNR